MKKYFQILTVLILLSVLLSCEALPVGYSSDRSWLISSGNSWTTLMILPVQVDRSGGWDSVEKEAAALAPLYFWESGCRIVAAGEAPSYAAQVQVREREYNVGWRTKKSLVIEVRIWEREDAPVNGEAVIAHKLPAAVGRIIETGDKSFSSSRTTDRLLSKAIKKAVKELAAYERNKDAY